MVIVTVVDRFFKAAHILALPKLPTALETTNLLVDQVFQLHSTPSNIIPNRGPNLHHKFGGLLPRPWKPPSAPTNQDLESALCCVAATHLSSWRIHLPWVEYVRNTLTSSVTGLSPFEASLGYQPPLSFQKQQITLTHAGVLSKGPGSSPTQSESRQGKTDQEQKGRGRESTKEN